MSPESPPMATQWFVEAKSGDTCVVRVVHSWFASTDEWDGQFEAVEHGWNAFFKILRLKLQHFRGQRGAAFDVVGMSSGSESDAWAALTGPFELTDAAEGQEARSSGETPTLLGKVAVPASAKDGERHLMLLASEPGAGVCHFFAMPMGEQVYVSIRFFLFGDGAADAVASVEPEWKRWFGERLPMGW